MRKFIIGLIMGLVLGGGIAWAAAQRTILLDSQENPLGTTEHPIFISN